jgi:hypothetical protein
MLESDSALKIARLTDLFADYEKHKSDLRGHDSLKRAIDAATETLLDDSSADLHQTVRTLAATWFQRVRTWQSVRHGEPIRSSGVIQLYGANLDLFEDPLLGIPAKLFEELPGWREFMIAMRKPHSARTPQDHKAIEEFIERDWTNWKANRANPES